MKKNFVFCFLVFLSICNVGATGTSNNQELFKNNELVLSPEYIYEIESAVGMVSYISFEETNKLQFVSLDSTGNTIHLKFKTEVDQPMLKETEHPMIKSLAMLCDEIKDDFDKGLVIRADYQISDKNIQTYVVDKKKCKKYKREAKKIN